MQLVKTESGEVINVIESHNVTREELVAIVDKAQAYLQESQANLAQFDAMTHVVTDEEAKATLEADCVEEQKQPEVTPEQTPEPASITPEAPAPVAPVVMTAEATQAPVAPTQVPDNLDIQ